LVRLLVAAFHLLTALVFHALSRRPPQALPSAGLDSAVALDLEDHAVSLRALSQQGPLVLVWLRHYG